MKTSIAPTLLGAPARAAALVLALAAVALFAATGAGDFTAGGAAYTKRVETPALAEPSPLAAKAGAFPYGQKLKIDEVRGRWLRVSAGKISGWVFAGDLAAAEPKENTGLGNSPLLASETSATAAARPLASGAVDYAARRGLDGARDDLAWVVAQSNAITPETVQTYLREAKKGAYAE